MLECWKEVKTLFQTFQEWFNDLELYHYVGFLVEQGVELSDIVDNWRKNTTKDDFISKYIIKEIKSKLSGCKDFSKQYLDKPKCRPILLLHNIQTIINQNTTLKKNDKYKLPVFYKFPFHLFKKEKWDVEHIDSNTPNSMDDIKEQKEWLKYSFVGVDDEELKKQIKEYVQSQQPESSFEDIQNKITKINDSQNKLSQEEKQQIWNYCLLDSSTNRSYGNKIFAAKRRVIIGKDQGKKIEVDDKLEVTETPGAIAFIPPCTKNVFMKYYNTATNNLREWDRTDAEAYLKDIETTLENFLK
jgi:hypothetical protein